MVARSLINKQAVCNVGKVQAKAMAGMLSVRTGRRRPPSPAAADVHKKRAGGAIARPVTPSTPTPTHRRWRPCVAPGTRPCSRSCATSSRASSPTPPPPTRAAPGGPPRRLVGRSIVHSSWGAALASGITIVSSHPYYYTCHAANQPTRRRRPLWPSSGGCCRSCGPRPRTTTPPAPSTRHRYHE